ncbi:hypothetical protein QJS04_geneDACA008816 [Acorus gramineus]|uniref:Phosphatidylinositol-glycan biosynthesis class W protein n=1 Tax=Acorus gramineus TaxID=55184 RepID=A0AAV9AE67_ACOGR|nr:hypothetical protein QJS04_geneDACA008816 [Acorus gramineus]
MDLLRVPSNPNKQLKEEFVSNLTGSSLLEIAALSFIVPALMVLRHWSGSASAVERENMQKKNDNFTVHHEEWRNYTVSLVVDFLCIVFPILLVFTVLAEWVYTCTICLMLMLFFCILAKRSNSSVINFKEGSKELSHLRTSISSFRVSVMIVTCLCILAVDFKIYPRRYAKTETYGIGLMDLGVGSFVVANALVSRQARNSLPMRWKDAIQSTSPLILLGIGRLISTTGVNYQVHVGEYGVHWNFFFTLAAVTLLTSIVNIHPRHCGVVGSLILIAYQICLLKGLNEYLLSNRRDMDIISQNKEGLFSVFGYWGMYLLGVHLGHYLFFSNRTDTVIQSDMWARIRIWFLCITLWLLALILDKYVERVSRRMCNLAYVTTVLAQNFQVLSVVMLSDFFPGKKLSTLEEGFNKNLLGAFLLANILTGLVNLYVDTLSVTPSAAFGILYGYAFVLCAVTGFASFCGVKFKFW